MLPLDGIVVLDLTRLLPGAAATACLANFGAEVVKIEQPGTGDYARNMAVENGASPIFRRTNLGKKSVAIDLKHNGGIDAFLALASTADVLIESFRPGVMDRLGLGYARLAALNPRLVYVSLSGYGQTGPYAQVAGHDINYLSLAGVLDLIGVKGGAPVIPGIQIADLAGGSMQAVIGILLALAARAQSGRGQMVDVAMLDGSAALLPIPLAMLETGRAPRRGDDLLNGRYACYHLYPARDGRWVSVGALEPKFWASLCRELGCVELIPDQFADEPRQSEVKAAIAARLATRGAEEWFCLLGAKDCCVTPVRTVEEAVGDPHFRERPTGVIPRLGETPGRAGQEAPRLGEHTLAILERAGIGRERVEQLLQEGAIECAGH